MSAIAPTIRHYHICTILHFAAVDLDEDNKRAMIFSSTSSCLTFIDVRRGTSMSFTHAFPYDARSYCICHFTTRTLYSKDAQTRSTLLYHSVSLMQRVGHCEAPIVGSGLPEFCQQRYPGLTSDVSHTRFDVSGTDLMDRLMRRIGAADTLRTSWNSTSKIVWSKVWR